MLAIVKRSTNRLVVLEADVCLHLYVCIMAGSAGKWTIEEATCGFLASLRNEISEGW